VILKELTVRLDHSSVPTAMIYQYVTKARDQVITEALSGLVHEVPPMSGRTAGNGAPELAIGHVPSRPR
jgi:hypothetical protein